MSARTLVVQSVLYGTAHDDLLRAAEALANSARLAVEAGELSTWRLALGDCSPEPVVTPEVRARLEEALAVGGGTLSSEFFGENLGSAAGHNRIAQETDSELILILNPDAQVAPDALTELAAQCTDNVGVAEARQVPFEHPKDYDTGTGDTSWASTACAMTPRGVFDAVDGFDARSFFLYCDDVDYSWRVRLTGKRVIYVPSAAVFHDKRLSVTGDWPASAAEIYYSAEAALILAHKYSHPEIVTRLEKAYARESNETVARALAEFRRRRVAGELVDPIDPGHRVGEFVKGNYSVHRF